MQRRGMQQPTGGEMKIAGHESVRAVFAYRPRDLRVVYLLQDATGPLSDLLQWCKKSRVPFHVVELDALTWFAETMRHDGVCVVARKKVSTPVGTALKDLGANPRPQALVLLDDVKNPNNVGAIARACAYFGSTHLFGAGDTVGLTAAAMRVSQGGAEAVQYVHVVDSADIARSLRERGFGLVATSSHAKARLGDELLPARCVLMLGGENAGLSRELWRAADLVVGIPGAGEVESLNVAAATTVLLWEHWRVHRMGESKAAPPATSTPSRRPTYSSPAK